MSYQLTALRKHPNSLPKLPGWASSQRTKTLETVAFRSGAMLTVLDSLLADLKHGVPVKLLDNRLALQAAIATSKLEGRMARETDIRDAFHLTPREKARGTVGDLLAFCRAAVQRRLAGRDWHGDLQDLVDTGLADDVSKLD